MEAPVEPFDGEGAEGVPGTAQPIITFTEIEVEATVG
jgi:hypothetical protein